MKRLIKYVVVYIVLMSVLGFLFGAPKASAITKQTCAATKKSAVYVVCVDNSNKNTQTLWVIDETGKTVYGPATVTTSHKVTDSIDSLTHNGQWLLGKPVIKSSIGLQYFIPFGGGAQALHYYRQVGWGYDSHGCIREDKATAVWLFDHVGAAILAGKRAEVDIMS